MGNNFLLLFPAKQLFATAVIVSCASCGRSSLATETANHPKEEFATGRQPVELAPSPVLTELPGIVTTSRHTPLLARTNGRIKRLFFQPGQYVRKGDILVKGYNHNFVVAPTNALVAERLIDGSSYLSPNTVVASLLELEPFQIQLTPLSPYAQSIAPGWEVNLSRGDEKTFAASGVVLGSHLSTDGSLFVDLRLRRLTGGSLLTGTKIRAVLLPPSL